MPDVEEHLESFHPRGSGDAFFGKKKDPALEKSMRAAWARVARRLVQNKWINPEYAFLSRADMGLWYLLEQLGAVVNISETARRLRWR